MADLTTEWAAYIVALKTANVDALDVTTLVANDVATVRAAMDGGVDEPDEVDDANTMYLVYLTA
jgi:hypothetical protein